jgi:hypothetical protein
MDETAKSEWTLAAVNLTAVRSRLAGLVAEHALIDNEILDIGAKAIALEDRRGEMVAPQSGLEPAIAALTGEAIQAASAEPWNELAADIAALRAKQEPLRVERRDLEAAIKRLQDNQIPLYERRVREYAAERIAELGIIKSLVALQDYCEAIKQDITKIMREVYGPDDWRRADVWRASNGTKEVCRANYGGC